MKKKIYTKAIDNEIIVYENNMLALYLEKINKYKPYFEKYGCSLKVGLMWKHFSKDATILKRASFQNGYQCYVYCAVQKDGTDVCISSFDDDVDYYPLSTAWIITSIFRNFFKLRVELYDNTNDVETYLNDFLSHLMCATEANVRILQERC